METTSRSHEAQNPSPANSPTTTNGGATAQTPPLTPRPVSRSEPNPYPTTFVQADTTNFKQVVQMLTGSSPNPTHNPDPAPAKPSSIPPVKTGQQKKPGFKLYERRNTLKNGLMINPVSGPRLGSGYGSGSGRFHEVLSPSLLDFPALVLSPVTPLTGGEDPFNSGSSPSVGTSSSSEEDRAIAEKGFYLHPSPRGAAAAAEQPRLLPLFPVSSPRVNGSPSSS